MSASGTTRAARWLPLLVAVACFDSDPPRAVGTLERDRLDLVAETSEPVVERPVEEGAWVEPGTLLVKLDPARQRARVAQVQGARDRAAARLDELVRGPRHQRIEEARARLQGAAGRLKTARSELERMQRLFDQGVTSQGQLDQERARFDEALAARNSARAVLDELLDGTTREELAQAEAALAEAEAALTDARVRLERLEVRAPVAGWVDALPFEPGEQPPPGGVVAVLLADEAPYGRVYVPASLRARVRPGTAARLHVDGVDEPLRGRVRTVAVDAAFTPYYALTERDRGRLVYLAKVDVIDPDGRRLPTGLPVQVEFLDESADVAAGADAEAPSDVRPGN